MTKTKEGNAETKPKSAIVFSATLASRLPTEYRLAPTYVGVRRVRPSSRLVQQAMVSNSSSATTTKMEPVVYKIKDPETGVERRMNAQEKKKLKLKLREERQQEKKLSKQQQQQQQQQEVTKDDRPSEMQSTVSPPIAAGATTKENRYLQLEVDKTALEQELADLRGERNGVPPVALAPALTQQAIRYGIFQTQNDNNNSSKDVKVVMDDALAEQWATALKSSMSAAEKVRSQQDMRPMPYRLVPEVWNRMRPPDLVDASLAKEKEEVLAQVQEDNSSSVAFCEIRPALATSAFDAVSETVIRLLHGRSRMHISCGSKFGCDFLLYDGPRESRHAFAGLRVLTCSESGNFPLPTAYNLAGYVRCLNTAGKLALLATVLNDESVCRVAIVDVALEKVVPTVGRSKQKTMEQRYKTLVKK